MTTQTKPTDPAVELAPIAEQLQAAREERDRLVAEARTWQDEGAKLERELADLARSDPAQFAGGFPRANSKAGKLRAAIDKRANGNRWNDILGGAERRVHDLEHQLSRVTEAHADALARAEYQGRGTANAEKWRRIAAAILDAEAEYRASTNAHREIVISVTGLDGQDIISDPTVAEAVKLAERLAEVQPPRSVSLAPLTTEDPLRVKGNGGGYISERNPGDVAEDQPERVEPV